MHHFWLVLFSSSGTRRHRLAGRLAAWRGCGRFVDRLRSAAAATTARRAATKECREEYGSRFHGLFTVTRDLPHGKKPTHSTKHPAKMQFFAGAAQALQ